MKKYSLLFLLFLSVISAISRDLNYSRVKIWFDGKKSSELSKLGIDLSEGEFRSNVWFVSDFSETEIARINNAGFRTEILIADVKSFYRDRNNSLSRSTIMSNPCETPPDYAVPAHFHLGSMGGFYTYAEMIPIIDSMALLYPSLISAKQVIDPITSIEGNPIYYLKISDNPNVDENEPEVLYDAVHHAREPQSMTQLIYYMWYLLENYTTDSTVRALVDNTEMYFIPCVNPDGYMYNEFTDPQGGGMWRKNRRDNLDGEFGVDLNRNYGYQWALDTNGSSQNTYEETYRGTSAFSEPETQAMRNFLNSRHILFTLNYHTYGDHHIIPWGFIPDLLTPDSVAFDLYGAAITRYNHYQVGTTNRTLHYLVNGAADDWMYGEQVTKGKIYSMTPEVGTNVDGFWPASNRIIDLSKENVYANLTLAKLAGKYGSIESNQPHYVSQMNNEFVFTFRQLGLDSTGTFTITLLPISSNIIASGSPLIISNLSVLQTKSDSISFTLSPSILPAEEIRYAVSVNNGLYTDVDTFMQVYGSPVSLLFDDCANLNNWSGIGTNWGNTTEEFVSSPSSITDSPFDIYQPNIDNKLTLSSSISLTGALEARLTFFTKWFTERQYDYIQLLASTDNGNSWIPLCGKYTTASEVFQIIGQPVYEGTQMDWVHEEINLNDFLGEDILLRFEIVTDGFQEFDGFYFDDLNVEIIPNNIGIPGIRASSVYLSDPVPNPSSSSASVNYSTSSSNATFIVYNIFGEVVWKNVLAENKGKIEIPVSKFAAGMYNYFIQFPDGTYSRSVKMVVSK